MAPPPCQTQLKQLLEQDYTRRPRGWAELARDIMRANGADKPPVDRRKLADVVAGEDVFLSLSQLHALDTYFAAHYRRGLAVIFDRPTVLRTIVQSRRVLFLVGAKPHSEGRAVSWWDTRAMHTLFAALNQFGERVTLDFDEVILRPAGPKLVDQVRDERWHKLLVRDDGPSVVCIGSPRANHAVEVMLARMYGVNDPFRLRAGRPGSGELRFIWPPARDGSAATHSAFAAAASDFPRADRSVDVHAGHDSGFAYKDHIHWLPAKNSKHTFGVCAATRRPNGAVWLAVCGLSGPGTSGAADFMTRAPNFLPASGDVLTIGVKVEVRMDGADARTSEARDIGSVIPLDL